MGGVSASAPVSRTVAPSRAQYSSHSPSGRARHWRVPRKSWVCAEGLGWLFCAAVRNAKNLHHIAPFRCPLPWAREPPGALPHGSVCRLRLAPSPSAEVLVLARYRAQKEDELSLAPGDVVRQVRQAPARGWLRGELGGRCGLFPKRLVQVKSGRAQTGRLAAPRSGAKRPWPCVYPQEIPEALRVARQARRPRCARLRRERPGNGPLGLVGARRPRGSRIAATGVGHEADLQPVIGSEDNAPPGAGPWLQRGVLAPGPTPSRRTRAPCSGSLSSISGHLAKSRGPQTWCRVNFNYRPEQADELELQAGEIVEMIKEVRR